MVSGLQRGNARHFPDLCLVMCVDLRSGQSVLHVSHMRTVGITWRGHVGCMVPTEGIDATYIPYATYSNDSAVWCTYTYLKEVYLVGTNMSCTYTVYM